MIQVQTIKDDFILHWTSSSPNSTKLGNRAWQRSFIIECHEVALDCALRTFRGVARCPD